MTAEVRICNSDGDVVATSELIAHIDEGNPGYFWLDVPQGLPTGDYSVEFVELWPSSYLWKDLSFYGFDLELRLVHSATLNEQLEAQNETIGGLQDQIEDLQSDLAEANDKLDVATTNLMIVMILAIIAVIVAVVVLVLVLRKKG
jgi:hypothetical protein